MCLCVLYTEFWEYELLNLTLLRPDNSRLLALRFQTILFAFETLSVQLKLQNTIKFSLRSRKYAFWFYIILTRFNLHIRINLSIRFRKKINKFEVVGRWIDCMSAIYDYGVTHIWNKNKKWLLHTSGFTIYRNCLQNFIVHLCRWATSSS